MRCVALIALLLSSCAFHLGEGELIERYETISVPFIEGDLQGAFTQSLINEVATQTGLVYQNSGGDLLLLVRLRQVDNENIGFQYDQKRKGKRIKYIIPDETRLSAVAEVSVVDSATGATLLGPTLLEACYDFDHDYYTAQNSVNIFSLGQLTDYDEAYDAALKPLYRNLATKIVDYIKAVW